MADTAFGDFDVIAYLAEILCLNELTVRSGMAVEILNLNNLPFLRWPIAVGHSHRSHESLPIFIQEIRGNGAMSVIRFLLGLGANDEGCRDDELTFEVLSRSSARVYGVAILAYESFGVRAVHFFHEVALGLRCHGCFADSQHVANSAKVLGQVHIADIVWLDAQIRFVHAEQIPNVEARICDFTVPQETLSLHSVQRFDQSRVYGNDLAEFVDAGIFPLGLLYREPPPIEFLLEPPAGVLRQ